MLHNIPEEQGTYVACVMLFQHTVLTNIMKYTIRENKVTLVMPDCNIMAPVCSCRWLTAWCMSEMAITVQTA